MSSAALLLERAPDSASKPAVGTRDDRFEREANELSERLAWRIPSSSQATGPLSSDVRGPLESELGYDLSAVRLRDDPESHAEAANLGARAFTLGPDIAFGHGAYDPATPDGRRTLAHEVVHTAQQGAVSPRGGGTQVSSSPPGVAQRTPGVDAQDSWNELIAGVAFAPDSAERRDRGNEATSRFLGIREGKRLINALWRIAHPKKKLNFKVGVSYVDQLPAAAGTAPASGWFTPRDDTASRYDVYVKHVAPPSPGSWTLPGGTTASGIAYTHSDPESDMATTLQHELMHVEFVRQQLAGMDYSVNPPEIGTGHKSNPLKDTDPLFLERETAAHNQMNVLEADLHKKAAELKAQQEQKRLQEERKRNEEEAKKRPPDAPVRETKPSFASGQVLLEGASPVWGRRAGRGFSARISSSAGSTRSTSARAASFSTPAISSSAARSAAGSSTRAVRSSSTSRPGSWPSSLPPRAIESRRISP